MRLRTILGLIAFALLVYIITEPPREAVRASSIYVIDGDTVDIDGERYRLTGFDTPETKRAECNREKALGDRATARLRELIQIRRPIELIEAKGRDKFGRRLAKLFVAHENVGDILVAEGLAREFKSGQRQGWC